MLDLTLTANSLAHLFNTVSCYSAERLLINIILYRYCQGWKLISKKVETNRYLMKEGGICTGKC